MCIVNTMKKGADKESKDVLLLHSPTEDGEGVRALRSRPGRIDLTELRGAKEGQDVSGQELVQLKPREDAPFICDVDVIYSPDKNDEKIDAGTRGGPPRVTTDAYRKSWDKVFGLKNYKRRQKPILN